jgi:hypothetical protein
MRSARADQKDATQLAAVRSLYQFGRLSNSFGPSSQSIWFAGPAAFKPWLVILLQKSLAEAAGSFAALYAAIEGEMNTRRTTIPPGQWLL